MGKQTAAIARSPPFFVFRNVVMLIPQRGRNISDYFCAATIGDGQRSFASLRMTFFGRAIP